MAIIVTDKKLGPQILVGGLFGAAIICSLLYGMLGFNSRWFALSYPTILIVADIVIRVLRNREAGIDRLIVPTGGGHVYFVPVWVVGIAIAAFMTYSALNPRPEPTATEGPSSGRSSDGVPGGVVNSNQAVPERGGR